MVSQFISTHEVGLLGDIDFAFPEGTHAIGRLDNHSEGLLLLTTNKKITRLLFLSETPHKRTYLVQVSHEVSKENLIRLQNGVTIIVKGGKPYTTSPCEVRVIEDPSLYCNIADRLTSYPPFTWIMLTITEGKFHQVRKMVGAIGHRCKRLVRISIEELAIDNLAPGAVKELDEETFFTLLKLETTQPVL